MDFKQEIKNYINMFNSPYREVGFNKINQNNLTIKYLIVMKMLHVKYCLY